MIIALLTVLFVIVCLLLILLILVQRGKSSMGLGSMGGSTQMLFGGSGGQDIFQKATWILGAIFMFGSLGLALLTTRNYQKSRYVSPAQKELPTFPRNNNE